MDASLGALLVRVVVSLGVVLAIMAGAAAVLRRSGVVGGRTPRRRTAPVEVVARQGLGRSSSVTVVRVGERALVLGVTDSSVSLLGEVDSSEILGDTPNPGLESPGGPGPSPKTEVPEGPEAPRTASPGSGFPPAAFAWKAVLENLRDRTVRRS